MKFGRTDLLEKLIVDLEELNNVTFHAAIEVMGKYEADFWRAYHLSLVQEQRIADLEEVLGELGYVLE